MKISTRGRYALRVMLDLAENDDGSYIPLTAIAGRQEISEKYLESVVSILTKGNLLLSLRGKNGGYRLARASDEYSVGEILHLTEGALAPVPCVETEPNECPRYSYCKTVKLWEGLYETTESYLNSITLKDISDGSIP